MESLTWRHQFSRQGAAEYEQTASGGYREWETFSPLGLSVEESWEGLVAGRSGIGPMTLCDPSDFPCQIAGGGQGVRSQEAHTGAGVASDGEVFAAGGVGGASGQRRMRVWRYDPETSHRYGVLLGNGNGGFPTTEEGLPGDDPKGRDAGVALLLPNDFAKHGGIEYQPYAGI